jgi:hypothetical protein
MRIALVDGTKKHTYYPFGLMRLSSYLKDKGHEPQIFYKDLPNPNDGWDEVWISAVFTFEIPHAISLIRAYAPFSKVVVGGISPTLMPEVFKREPCEVYAGKHLEAEKYPLDYAGLGFKPEYSMGKITDGCIRKCKFCVVPTLETEYIERPAWKDDILDSTKYVVFSDNNYTARPLNKMREDLAYFDWLTKNTKNRYIDFNQALDCRIVTDEMADLLAAMPIRPYRFSYDGKQEDGFIVDTITKLASRGKKDFTVFMLYNFMDTIEYTYERMRTMVSLAEALGVNIAVYPMRYQPFEEIDENREYVGKHWTTAAKKSFMAGLNSHSLFGQFSFSSMEHFEYWFTDSPEKFKSLLHYPDARKLFARKKAALRQERLRGEHD